MMSPTIKRWGPWLGLGILALVTGYLVVLAVVWNARVNDLRADVSSLQAEYHETAPLATDALQASGSMVAGAEELRDDILGLANDLAQARDHQEGLESFASALIECIDERKNFNDHMERRYLYTPSSVRAVERELDAYCDGVQSGLDELLEEWEG